MKRIYVGNIPFGTTEDQLTEVFAAYGEVRSVSLPTDRVTGRPRGFGFVEMADDGEADSAIEALNGSDLGGRSMNVNEARPREERRGGRGR